MNGPEHLRRCAVCGKAWCEHAVARGPEHADPEACGVFIPVDDGPVDWTIVAGTRSDVWVEGRVIPKGGRVPVVRADRALRMAQALRTIRDTTEGYPANVARRALEEAGVRDPYEVGG